MNNKKMFLISLFAISALTALNASAKTYCGILGDQKIELDSKYFAMKPDYEGYSPWEANDFEPNADCSSKLILLSARTNIDTGEPSRGASEKGSNIVIFYEPAKDNLFLNRYANSFERQKEFKLINNSAKKAVYEDISTNSFNMRNVARKTVYLDNGQVTEIFECGFNTTTKINSCTLFFYSEKYNVKIYGNYNSLKNFVKARNFSVEFINKARIIK